MTAMRVDSLCAEFRKQSEQSGRVESIGRRCHLPSIMAQQLCPRQVPS